MATKINENFGLELQYYGIEPETVEVGIHPEVFVPKYAEAFIAEAQYNNPDLFDAVGLTEEEFADYCKFLMKQRIDVVHNDCKIFRYFGMMWFPTFLEWMLTCIGQCEVQDKTILLDPKWEGGDVIDLEKALEISRKIGRFSTLITMVQGGMEKSFSGESQVMSQALIAGHMRSMTKLSHSVYTYLAYFAGVQLRHETEWKALYRQECSKTQLIEHELMCNPKLFH